MSDCDVVTYLVMIYLSSSCLTQISPCPGCGTWIIERQSSPHVILITCSWSGLRYLIKITCHQASPFCSRSLFTPWSTVTRAPHLKQLTELEGWWFIVIFDPLAKVVIIDNNRGFISEGYLPLLLIMIWYFSQIVNKQLTFTDLLGLIPALLTASIKKD